MQRIETFGDKCPWSLYEGKQAVAEHEAHSLVSLLSSAPASWSPMLWYCFLAVALHGLRLCIW